MLQTKVGAVHDTMWRLNAMMVQAVCGGAQVSYQGQSIDLGQPFRRASMHELVQDKLGPLFFALHLVLLL